MIKKLKPGKFKNVKFYPWHSRRKLCYRHQQNRRSWV